MSEETMYEAQSRVDAMIQALGVTKTLCLMHYIKSWPDRCFYEMWILPDHRRIKKALNIDPKLYSEMIQSLVDEGYLVKRYELKIQKFVYAVNFLAIEQDFASTLSNEQTAASL